METSDKLVASHVSLPVEDMKRIMRLARNTAGIITLEDGKVLDKVNSWLNPLPPLPPEPPVGTVIYSRGRLWQRWREGEPWRTFAGGVADWSWLAEGADLAVPEKKHRKQVMDELIDWLDHCQYYGAIECIRGEFGGDDD